MRQAQNLLYTKEHEWVEFDTKTKTAFIGISDYAQQSLGDIVFVELPKVGNNVEAGKVIGSVESVKTVSDIYSPLSGKIIAINEELNNAPEIINQDVYGKGWMFQILVDDDSKVHQLLNYADYQKNIQ